MKSVLIVDDEELFTLSVAEGLRAFDPSLDVRVAANGSVALQLLEQQQVDLLVTDLHMPVMDGFELLARITRQWPQLPVLVMTAFGTGDTAERLHAFGVDNVVEKPIDFEALAGRIAAALNDGAAGYVRGITLPTFMQIVEVERKTCTLKVTSRGQEGRLHFKDGVLFDADAGALSGEAAVLEILAWEEAGIQIGGGSRRRERSIAAPLAELLLESARQRDERVQHVGTGGAGAWPASTTLQEERLMSVHDKLKELAAVDGFAGVGLFTPTGESLGALTAGNGFKVEIGVLANNVLINAQKSSIEMGAGRGQMVHIEAEKAHILARCLNEGTDALKSQPGKAHVHMVVVLSSDASIGMAKLKMSSVIEKLAEDFRI